MSRLLARAARFAASHRAAVLAAYLLASGALFASGLTIRLETSLIDLLPRGTASADDLRAFLASGGTLDRLFISIGRGRPGSGDDAEALAGAAEELSAGLRSSGLVRDVRYGVDEGDLDRLSAFALQHLPVLVAASKLDLLAARLAPSAIHEAVASLGRRASMPGFAGPLKDLAARDPLGLLPLVVPPGIPGAGAFHPDPESGLFLSRDGRRLLVVAEPVRPPTEIDFSRALMSALATVETRVRARPGGADLVFDHAGGHLFALEDEKRVRHDAAFTSLFSFAGVGLIYLFVIRRPALWLAILVPLVMATVWTLGLAAIYPGHLNMITVCFAAVLLGIGDDAMLHIYLREREERAAGAVPRDAVIAAFRATGSAAVVATLATAAAFLSLAFVRFRGLAELGIIGAIGMATLLVGVIFFFPAALSYLGARESRAPAPSIRLPVAALLRAYDAAASRRRGVLLAIGALTAAMLVAAPGVRVSTDLRSIRGDDPAAAGMARVLAPFAAAGAAESMVVTGGDAGTLEAFCREAIAAGRIAACGRAEAGVPSAPVQRERFEKISLLPWEAAVATLEDEARAAGMNEEFFAPFTGAALRYADFESVAIAPGTDRPRLPSTTLFFEEQASAAGLAADLRARAGDVRIASIALVASDLSRVLAEDFRRAAAIVAVVIAAMMLAAFRRVRASAVTLLPVAIGTIWMLGTARLLGVELNLMSLMGMPVVFGLGVDFGVYLVDRWRTEGGDARAALAGAGPAVLVTGLTTLAGFAALLAADLAGLRSLGFTVVAGAGYSLLAALIVVPLLLPGVERPPPRG